MGGAAGNPQAAPPQLVPAPHAYDEGGYGQTGAPANGHHIGQVGDKAAETSNAAYEYAHESDAIYGGEGTDKLSPMLGGGMMSTAFSVAQMQMTDYQNGQKVQEQIAYSTVQGSEHYDAIVNELAANGIEISTEAEQQVDDIEASQAMLAAASTGMLDYGALESSLEEAGEGSLSAYIGEKLLEAHNNGTPLNEIDFGTELLNPMSADSVAADQSQPRGGGISSAFSVGRMQMIDYQNSQGLVEAAQRGLIDMDTLNAVAQEAPGLTGEAMAYIAEVEANGGDYEAYTFEQYRADQSTASAMNEQYAELAAREMRAMFGDDSKVNKQTLLEAAEQHRQNFATAHSIYSNNFTTAEAYDAAVEDLAAQGVEITTGEDQQEEDMLTSNAIMAAAASGILDYDALAENMENIEDGSMAAYLANTLLDAHNNGVPFEEIDFGVEFPSPMEQYNAKEGNQPLPGGGGVMSTAFSVAQIQMVDYQSCQSLQQVAQMGIFDSEALNEVVGTLPEGTSNMTNVWLQYMADVSNNGGEFSAESFEKFQQARLESQDASASDKMPGGMGHDNISTPMLSVSFSVAQMQMTDYQNAQAVQEQIANSNIKDMDDYGSIVAELQANGIEIDVPEEQQAEDLASTQAMMAAASTGVLDYDALAASLEEAGEGSLSAYVGEKLIAAHGAGMSVQDIEFDSDLIRPNRPNFEMPEGTSGSGMTTAFAVAQMQMTDYQNSQGLLQAAQQGLIDQNALSIVVEQNAQSNAQNITAQMMNYIASAAAEGAEVDMQGFETFTQEYSGKIQDSNAAQEAPTQQGGEGNDTQVPMSSMMSVSYSVAQMQMVDYQNANAIQEQIAHAAIDNLDEYSEVVKDLQANGVQLASLDDTDVETLAKDMETTQAMLAAASMDMLDYDALAASLDEAGEGSLASHVATKLLEAHENGTPLNDIDFGTELLSPMSADSVAVDPANKFGGMTNMLAIQRMQMVDYQNSQSLIQAAEHGYLDMGAVSEAAETGNLQGISGDVVNYIAAANANGQEVSTEGYTVYRHEQEHAKMQEKLMEIMFKDQIEVKGGKGDDTIKLPNLEISKQVQDMIAADMQNVSAIQDQINKANIKDLDDYSAVVADLQANGVNISTDEEHMADDLASTQAMLAAASTGILDYDALAASLEEGAEGSLSAYIGEKLIAAHDAGMSIRDIEFDSDRINFTKPAYDMPKPTNGAGAGMGTAFSVAQQGLINQNALNIMIEQSAQNSGTMTARAMEYISYAAAEGVEVNTQGFETFTQEYTGKIQDNNEAQEAPTQQGGEGNDTQVPMSSMMSVSYSVAQMQMVDYQNANAIQEQIAHAAIDNLDEYSEVVKDLQANGVQLASLDDTDVETLAKDMETTQAMLAAASMDMLDYDALAASLDEAGEGSLASHVATKLLEAHENGTPLNDIDFGTELLSPMSADSVAVDPANKFGGMTNMLAIQRMQMVDYQNSQSLIQAAEHGFLDMDAVSEAAETGNLRGISGEVVGYIADANANGQEVSTEGYTVYHHEQEHAKMREKIMEGMFKDHIEVRGGKGDDTIIQAGGEGDDTLRPIPGKGNDTIIQAGGEGDDTLRPFPGKGNDINIQAGGEGDDTLRPFPGKGDDTIVQDGGIGIDNLLSKYGQDANTLPAGTDQLVYIGGEIATVVKNADNN
ncbi:MAG: calcium-binding protein [bacterium]|nr:calcium-binding protein [bacterium]